MTKINAWAPLALAACLISPLALADESVKATADEAEQSAEEKGRTVEAADSEAATASAVEQPVESEAPEEQLFCRTVKRVGSHRRIRVCQSTEEIERSSREAEDFQESLRPTAPAGQGLGAGG